MNGRGSKKPSMFSGQARMFWVFAIFLFAFIVIAVRFAIIQIVEADEYAEKADIQQIRDTTISNIRGTIYDRNLNILAINENGYEVVADPRTLKKYIEEKELDYDDYIDSMAQTLYDIIGDDETGAGSGADKDTDTTDTDEDEASDKSTDKSAKTDSRDDDATASDADREEDENGEADEKTGSNKENKDKDKNDKDEDSDKDDADNDKDTDKDKDDKNENESGKDRIISLLKKDTGYARIARYVDEAAAEKIIEARSEGTVASITLNNASKRYYPLGELACHVIGTTNYENSGLSGIELYYNQYLDGLNGRLIRTADRQGRSITNGIEEYYPPSGGYSLMLTIDEVIQHYVEKAIEKVQISTQSDKVMAIAMDPKNGDVLAMASYPNFDLNNPRVPVLESEQKALAEMTDEEKVIYWNEMWRNPMINDTYEPGSTFKLMTTSIALDQGVTDVDEKFYCNGYYKLFDTTLRCWRYYNPHGAETLEQAVANSCNPVFIQLSQRVGINNFYDYLSRLNADSKTGIDFPGEASAIVQDSGSAGPVGLATMSYGQGMSLTPLEMITALCSLGNDGYMMKPRLVKAFVDSSGNTVEEFQPEIVRQVFSKDTVEEMKEVMQYVITNGSGSSAYIPGYRIGGKTGTAQKPVNGRYTDEVWSSIFCMAPMDDPAFALLIIADAPKGETYAASTTGPGAYEILNDTLKYLNIEPVYNGDEKESKTDEEVQVPDFTGRSYSAAAETVRRLGLKAIPCPDIEEDFEIVDQYPKAGEFTAAGSSVCLYSK